MAPPGGRRWMARGRCRARWPAPRSMALAGAAIDGSALLTSSADRVGGWSCSGNRWLTFRRRTCGPAMVQRHGRRRRVCHPEGQWRGYPSARTVTSIRATSCTSVLSDSLPLQHFPNFFKFSLNVSFRKSYLTQSVNIRKLFTALFQHHNCSAKSKASLE
jgi:hypothetical protein